MVSRVDQRIWGDVWHLVGVEKRDPHMLHVDAEPGEGGMCAPVWDGVDRRPHGGLFVCDEADIGFTDPAPEFMTTVAGTRAQRPDTGPLIEKRHEPTNIDVDFVVANPWIY